MTTVMRCGGGWQGWDEMVAGREDRVRRDEDDAAVRIGDAERNRTRDLLTQHYADGRLDAVELEQRLEEVLQARRSADLRRALRELPHLRTASDRRRERAAGAQGLARAALVLGAFVAWFSVVGVGFFGVMAFFWFGLPAIGGALGWGRHHHRPRRQMAA